MFSCVFSKPLFLDIREKWGRHIWGKWVVGMFVFVCLPRLRRLGVEARAQPVVDFATLPVVALHVNQPNLGDEHRMGGGGVWGYGGRRSGG